MTREEYLQKPYLVIGRACVDGDEMYAQYVNAIDKRDIARFMNSTFCVSVGAYEDDTLHKTKDYMEAKPITKKELQVLEKFGMMSCNTGYWDFYPDERDGDFSDKSFINMISKERKKWRCHFFS